MINIICLDADILQWIILHRFVDVEPLLLIITI